MDSKSEMPLRSVPAAEARALLAEHEGTDLSIAAFARSKGVKPWSLYNARAASLRRADRTDRVDLVELRPRGDARETTGSVTAPLELSLPSGITLRIDRDFDEVALRRLLGVLVAC